MLQRQPASRPASRSPPDQKKITLPPVQPQDELQQGGRDGGQQGESENRGRPLASPQLSAARRSTFFDDNWRPAVTRDLGFHSILNPTEPEASAPSNLQVGAPVLQSPTTAGGPPQLAPNPPTGPPHTFSGQQRPHGASADSYGGTLPRVRKILTPRSPSRVVSATNRGVQSIDAQHSPFLASRGRLYTAEPGQPSEVPPMPTPPGQPHRGDYGFPPTASTPIVDRRTSAGAMQVPGQAPPSQSASPSISASSQNPSSSQTSPASIPYQRGPQAPQTATPYFPGSSFASSIQQGGGMQMQGATAGTLIAVPVDVHQASRLADEKRARNAGASARFRQRRKEKEKEASTQIDKLNQRARELESRLRDAEQDAEFYRSERDRLRDEIYRHPEMRHVLRQGPPSPRTLRETSFPAPLAHQQMGGQSPQMGFPPPGSAQERAPRRRRTDVHGEFASIPYSLPPASTLPPVQAPGFAQGHPSLPPLRIDNMNTNAPPRTTGASMTLSVRTPLSEAPPQPPGSYGSYARSPYERGWPGEGGRR